MGSIFISLEEQLIIIMVRFVELLWRVWVTIHARKDFIGSDDGSSGLGLVDLLSACHFDQCSRFKRVLSML